MPGPEEQKAPEPKKVKDHILVLDRSKNLPPELPPKIIYWNRCETRVYHEDLITND